MVRKPNRLIRLTKLDLKSYFSVSLLIREESTGIGCFSPGKATATAVQRKHQNVLHYRPRGAEPILFYVICSAP